MTDDPFAKAEPTDAKPSESKEPVDTAPEEFDAEAYFETEMVIGEEEFEQPKEYRAYSMPEDKTWVPVEIIKAGTDTRSMRVLVGSQKTPTEVELDRFVLECQHVSTAYGERAYPYLLSVPVFDVELPSKRGSWKKDSGRRLLAATRVTKPGQKITKDTLDELAEAMVGKVVMAQIRHVTKDYTDSKPRTNPDGTFVKAKTDEDGVPLRVVEVGGSLVMETSDTPCPVGKENLIKIDGAWLIPDPDGQTVTEVVTTTKTFDNLQDNVAPVPTRDIAVTRTDGTEIKAQVTMETVGRMTTKPLRPGTKVSVDVDGVLVEASWIGTSWHEAPGDSFDAYKGD